MALTDSISRKGFTPPPSSDRRPHHHGTYPPPLERPEDPGIRHQAPVVSHEEVLTLAEHHLLLEARDHPVERRRPLTATPQPRHPREEHLLRDPPPLVSASHVHHIVAHPYPLAREPHHPEHHIVDPPFRPRYPTPARHIVEEPYPSTRSPFRRIPEGRHRHHHIPPGRLTPTGERNTEPVQIEPIGEGGRHEKGPSAIQRRHHLGVEPVGAQGTHLEEIEQHRHEEEPFDPEDFHLPSSLLTRSEDPLSHLTPPILAGGQKRKIGRPSTFLSETVPKYRPSLELSLLSPRGRSLPGGMYHPIAPCHQMRA